MGVRKPKTRSSLIVADVIPDEPLQNIVGSAGIGDADDLLRHGVLAAEVAALALTRRGRLNIAVFGPWGAGKSSFFGLLQQELRARTKTRKVLTFNAWENAGSEFHSNFLSALAGPGSDIDRQLYQSTRKVELPTLQRFRSWKPLVGLVILFLLLIIVFPLLATLVQSLGADKDFNFLSEFAAAVPAFFAIPAGGVVVAAVITLLVDLSKVTVEISAPSHVSEFKKLFDKQVGKKEHVIFIDELDRCGPDDIMLTLEGLRTFLDHPNCVFIVAFDRDAVSSTIASNSKNIRSERSHAYYRTSGEYLDKVFQFQVSLPPQQGHVTREFAKKLVVDRGGVWEEMRNSGADMLDRVVSILSPIHVTSPRRTKVLLNDFAVSARTYQDLGFAWLDRAEEIAILSVIKTEFPYFAADLEREPTLLEYLASERTPTRPALVKLVDSYKAYLSEPSQTDVGEDPVLEDVVASSDGVSSVNTPTDRVNRALAQQLFHYIQKLQDERSALPKADIILMRNDPDLGGFEDGSLHSTLLLAGEAGREETVAAIQLASEADQGRAIFYLLRRLEGMSSSSEWSIGLLNVTLEVVRNAPMVPGSAAALLLQRWESSTGRTDLADRLTINAIKGIARVTAEEFSSSTVGQLIERTADFGKDAVTAVVEELLARLAAAQLAECSTALFDLICDRDLDIYIAAQGLSRLVKETTESMTDEHVARLADAYSDSDDEVSAGAAWAGQSATDGNDEGERVEVGSVGPQSEFAQLVANWQGFPANQGTRAALLETLRRVDAADDWALDLHDRLLTIDVDEGLVEVAGNEALNAIADVPELAEQRWLEFLPAGDSLDGEIAEMAVIRSLAWALDEPVEGSRLASAANVISKVRSASSVYVTDETVFAQTAQALLPSETNSNRESEFDARIELVTAIEGLSEVDASALWVGIVQWALSDDASEATFTNVVYVVSKAPDGYIEVLVTRLESERAERNLNSMEMRVLVQVQSRRVQSGSSIKPVDWEEIVNAIPATEIAHVAPIWLRTGAHSDQVELSASALSLDTFSVDDWGVWSKLVTPADRTAVWRLGSGVNLSAATLAAIVSSGPSSELYDELVEPFITGASSEIRKMGMTDFSTLPLTPIKARVAMGAISALAVKALGVDGPLAHLIAGSVANMLTPQQKQKVKKALAKWPDATIARDNRSALETAGLLERKNLFQRVFGGGGTS